MGKKKRKLLKNHPEPVVSIVWKILSFTGYVMVTVFLLLTFIIFAFH